MAKWIEFVTVPSPGVTKRWEVRPTNGGSRIGLICWYSGWRRYVLRPDYNSEWEQDCLRDVADFLEAQTREHKARRAACPEPGK